MATLGGLEQLALLAALRLDGEAYAVSIRAELIEQTGKAPSRGALYTVLDRLEAKGYLTSRMGAATPERGGRPKRFYKVTASGIRVLRASKQSMTRLWRGLESILEKNN